jgi:hypothetical protein
MNYYQLDAAINYRFIAISLNTAQHVFRASSCPSSGANQLQQQALVYLRNVVVAAVLLVVADSVESTTTNNTATTTFLR